MEPDPTADKIRERMSELRGALSCDVEDVTRSARAMTDVGRYVRRFPWATVAIAAAVGYLLVPRRTQVVYPDPATIAKLIQDKQLKVETKPSENSVKSMAKSLLVMGLMTGARTGINLFMDRLVAAARPPHAADDISSGTREPMTV